uniref:transmembrane 6 superfamily member 2-like n=1 Tax=Styela clava TaxID=7725 RepID=UPI0019399798|nr:transmembrane 6 superfamily member 2-like [Styela clava]
MNLQGTIVAFLVSQSSWGLLYIVGSTSIIRNPLVMLAAGVIFIPGFAILLRKLLPSVYEDNLGTHKRNWFFYMCCLFSWSCVIDIVLCLESLGYIDGYMDFYLESGEPYFITSFGIYINMWDAVIHYILYLTIIYKYDNKQDYRSYGIYWLGSMLAGMFVLTIGAIVGSYGNDLHPAMFLNIPYIILPFCALVYLLRLPRDENSPVQEYPPAELRSKSIGAFDILVILGLIASTVIGFVRGLASLGSPFPMIVHYVKEYEPYLSDPTKFGALHCLFNFVYCLPAQVMLIYALVKGGGKWADDLSTILSGAMAQGVFFHALAAVSSLTPLEFRVVSNVEFFLVLNALIVLVPHFAMFRLKQKKNEHLKFQ